MNRINILGIACAALAFFTAGTSMAVDNTGSGGTIMYTDSNGLNPVASPPYADGYVVHAFTASGTLNVPWAVNADVLVVGGGGGGGCVGTTGGGGGAGGVSNSNGVAVASGDTTVTVGAGGLGGKIGTGARNATSGSNSVFGGITAFGGGNGAGNTQNAGTGSGVVGSGGGGAYPGSGGARGTGTPGQGKDGGAGQTVANYGQGGGGGAGSDGQGGSGTFGGAGGDGLYFAAFSSWGDTNNPGYFGGGGGGSYRGGVTAGGLGGKGGGGQGGNGVGLVGQANTGGGGGGADYNSGGSVTAGNGGSGIVIVRYPYAADQLSVSVSSPTAGQAFLVGSPISATATVQNGTGPYLVSFFADTAGGGMVQVGTTQSGSGPTFAQSLGSPPNGTYHVYASVTDSAGTPATATSATITFSADGTAPTLAGSAIVDDKSGGLAGRNTPVTYTVTFSEDMDASTVDAADFGNAGSSTITVGSITETSPGVFSVGVTPTSDGTLQLKINAGAVLTDAAGNALDTTSAILDDTTLTVGTIQIVNIDFNGLRPGDAGHAGTYVGVSAAGTGTVFNPITADSTGGNDNLTVSASGLIDETGTSTAVAFSISPVGGDHESAQTFGPASLYDDFIFNNSAGNNSPAGSPFTISGLGDSPTADVYFYVNSFNYMYNPSGQISITGVVGNGVDGTYNGLRATRFLGVPVSGGSITGVFGSNGAQSVLGGLTVVSVTSQALEPEIAVEQPAGTDITSGGSRGFGTVTLGSNTSLEFTIKNTGTSALNLTGTPPDHVVVGGTNPGDFTVTSQPSTPVSSGGGTTTFTVQFAPGAAGARSATLTIANNDSDEGSFVINVTGTGQALEPEIAVEQPAGTDITSGGSRGFGTVALGSNTSLEFTIKNTGTSALNLTGTPLDHVVVGGTNPGDFTVTSQPSTPVSSGGGTTTFTVQFAPGAAGARSATLTIANDDPTGGENPFVINLSGTGGTGTIQIVNIDFNGTRNGDGNPTTFTGLGAVTNGGGTVFNGLLADSQGSPENDALTVGGSNLRDEFNTLTTVGFTIGPVGGDTLTGDNLTKDYIFVNSAGSSTDATFTISGLGAGTADLYFQLGSVGPGSGAGVFITGSTPTAGFSGNGHSWLFFNDVPITGGSITGTLGNPDFNPGPDNGDVVTLTGMTIVSGTGQTAYQAWATGSESFNGDANGDGVQDGLAFLLGAATPGTNATGLLPTVSKNGTGLVMTFDCLSAANRGTAVLNLQHSGDLGLTDAWAAALVPSTEPLTVTVSGVDFVTTANGALIHVVATIPSSGNDLAGKLFGRLKASETP